MPQLCCTNRDVVRICTEELLQAMRAQPKATVFSVSINDYWTYCECPECQKLAKAEDSQMGPVLQLVNHAAEAVEKEFPSKAIETLAYLSVQHRRNIFGRDRTSLSAWPRSGSVFPTPWRPAIAKKIAQFAPDLEGWAKISSRVWIWDYVADFGDYLAPFPNHRMLAPNIRYYVAHNVKGIFLEGAYNSPDSELAALGGYIMAKLLWNPNCDPNLARDEFLAGYYGKAAIPIRQYLDLLNGRAEQHPAYHFYGRDSFDTTSPIGIPWELPSPYLTYEFLIQANNLWQQAENFTADDAEGDPAGEAFTDERGLCYSGASSPTGAGIAGECKFYRRAPLKGSAPPIAVVAGASTLPVACRNTVQTVLRDAQSQ